MQTVTKQSLTRKRRKAYNVTKSCCHQCVKVDGTAWDGMGWDGDGDGDGMGRDGVLF